jgi:hypothetical protein
MLPAAFRAPIGPARSLYRRIAWRHRAWHSSRRSRPGLTRMSPSSSRVRNAMSEEQARKDNLLDQIADVHEHFIDLMNQRLPEIGERELELYFGVLGKLVAKLEERDKPLRAAAQEVFADVASIVMTELAR